MNLMIVRNVLLSIACGVLIFGSGYRMGVSSAKKDLFTDSNVVTSMSVSGKTPPSSLSIDFSLFWQVWNKLAAQYVDKAALKPQDMVYGAISGMVSALGDPYTVFLPPTLNKESKDDLQGKFEGIGAQLGIKEKKIVIIAPIKDSPAQQAGLKAGDWIIKVDGKETANWTLPEAVSKIRGEKGTRVTLTIFKTGAEKPEDVSVVRDTINVVSVEQKNISVACASSECTESTVFCETCSRVSYLKLTRFGDQTNDEWDKAVATIVKEQSLPRMKGMILDLRNNPGGYLAGSVYIGSEFLKEGTIVRQQYADGHGETFTVNRKGKLQTIPVVVLINKGSASASEIVAGALRDHKRATLVGETTFGKGSIQEVQELEGGAGIHITVAKWLLPSGTWINGKGIAPDIEVKLDEEKPEKDLQLERAFAVLMGDVR